MGRRINPEARQTAATARARGAKVKAAASAAGVSPTTARRAARASKAKVSLVPADLLLCRDLLVALLERDDVSARDRTAAVAELRKTALAISGIEAVGKPGDGKPSIDATWVVARLQRFDALNRGVIVNDDGTEIGTEDVVDNQADDDEPRAAGGTK